jgi:hypothetical protein
MRVVTSRDTAASENWAPVERLLSDAGGVYISDGREQAVSGGDARIAV